MRGGRSTIVTSVAVGARTAFVSVGLRPGALVIVVVAFSIQERPRPSRPRLRPDAFNGQRAMTTLGGLADPFPGSAGRASAADVALAATSNAVAQAGRYLARTPRRTSRCAHAGRRSTASSDLQTWSSASARVDQAGPGIVVVAHRDALGRWSRRRAVGTAALSSSRVSSARRGRRRTLTLVSTSGGSGGAAGGDRARTPRRAATGRGVLVLGDLASDRRSSRGCCRGPRRRGSARYAAAHGRGGGARRDRRGRRRDPRHEQSRGSRSRSRSVTRGASTSAGSRR